MKPSPSEGFGIFARVNFKQGDHILDVLFEREITKSNPLNLEAGEREDHCAYPDGKMMLVAFPARHMNHSCNPNAFYRYESGIPKAFARRAIEAGEEVTVDYLINNAGGDSWPCQCGASRCRGETGTSFFDLPIEFQKEYHPLLAPWFKDRFREKVSALEALLG